MATPASPELASAKVARRAATPVAGAIAGIIFAEDTGSVKFALFLVPFAGLAFLWFIAVARERLGRFEDQFFSTVFIGSGLLFLAMIFAAAATAGAIVAAAANDPTGFASSTTYDYARQTVTQILAVYALRMAAIFQLSQASLWLRTRVMPRWMALVTIVVALLLLFVFTQSWWRSRRRKRGRLGSAGRSRGSVRDYRAVARIAHCPQPSAMPSDRNCFCSSRR